MPNRLAREKSPYLLQHQWNPVDWYPFGEEAFAAAREQDKALFLSIGYSTCHWCHVMERESFENEDVARVMNELFVNVKIDREERPDVDQIYMQATIAMHGQGGWPLSIFATPDLQPFYCGTYFPPSGRYGRPGFVDVLRTMADAYRNRRDDVRAQAAECLRWLARPPSSGGDDGVLDALPAKAEKAYLRSFDADYGGFGGAPKFPRPAVLDFLAHLEARTPDAERRRALGHTLEMMWRGGIYDHVGGGFCRYATDDRWLVPHFEKMLYDNAQLVDAYLDGAALCGRPDFVGIAEDVAAFVAREMRGAEGGFFSAQDADSDGEEGKFYTFTLEELERALGRGNAGRAARIFGATEGGNFEGANILHWPASVDATAKDQGEAPAALERFVREVRCKLYGLRETRVRPALDDKVITSWNGLMIHAFARLGATTGRSRFVDLAVAAAAFVDARLRRSDGALLRRFRDGEARFSASLDDHAFLAFGELGLFEATGDPVHLRRALDLVARARAIFADPSGGFYFAAEEPDLVVRMKESHDGALPSGNSMMALLCARLGAIVHDEALREAGRQTVRAFAEELGMTPHAYPLMLAAWQELAEPPRTLVVTGTRADPAFTALLARAHGAVFPGRVIVPALVEHRDALTELGVGGKAGLAFETAPRALLCEDETCRPF